MPNTYVLIEGKSLSSNQSAIEFTSIPQTYSDLLLKVSAKSTRSSFGDLVMRFNSSTTGFVNARFGGPMSGSPSTFSNSSEWTNMSSDGQASQIFTNVDFYIPEYTSSKYKTWSVDNVAENNDSSAYITMGCGTWENTAAITSIKLFDISDSSNNNLKTNSTVYLYGIKKP